MSANETEFTITGDVKWSAINSPFKDIDIQLIEGDGDSVIISINRRLARRRLTTTSCVKNQSEIYCIVPSRLLKMGRLNYHASIVDLGYNKSCQ